MIPSKGCGRVAGHSLIELIIDERHKSKGSNKGFESQEALLLSHVNETPEQSQICIVSGNQLMVGG